MCSRTRKAAWDAVSAFITSGLTAAEKATTEAENAPPDSTDTDQRLADITARQTRIERALFLRQQLIDQKPAPIPPELDVDPAFAPAKAALGTMAGACR